MPARSTVERASVPARTTAEHPSVPVRVNAIEWTAFILILAIFAVRPLMSEVFEHIQVSFLEESQTGPTPATTVWLDAILLAAAAIGFARRIGRRSAAGVLAATGVALLLLAVVLSTANADNKRLAANAGASFFVGVIATIALIRLMRTPRMVAFALAAMFATGAATAWKCVAWRWYEFEDTREMWLQQREQMAQRGVDPGEGFVENFTRRLGAGESSGYFSHPNNAGSVLMMWLLAAAGLLIGFLDRSVRRADRESPAAVAVLSILCAAFAIGLWLTHSAGANVGLIAGLALLPVFGLAGDWIARRPGLALAVLAGGYVAALAAGAAYGAAKGTLPHPSLAFRWHYWSAAGQALAASPWLGVGRENFLQQYLLYKPAESPEQVRNAHELWLTLWVELGLAGLAAGVFLIGAWGWAALRGLQMWGAGPGWGGLPARHAGWGAGEEIERSRDQEIETRGRNPKSTIQNPKSHEIRPLHAASALSHAAARSSPLADGRVIMIAAVLILHAVFARPGLGFEGVLILWLMEIAAIWAGVFLFATSVLKDPLWHTPWQRWATAGLIAAVIGSLVHNLVGFALFVPAGLGVFGVIAAAAIAAGGAARREEAADAKLGDAPSPFNRMRAPAALFAGAALFVFHLIYVAVPTTRTHAAMHDLRTTLTRQSDLNALQYAMAAAERAVQRDPWDSASAHDLAGAAFSIAAAPTLRNEVRLDWALRAVAWGDVARRRSPGTAANWVLNARLAGRLAELLRLTNRADRADATRRAAANFWQEAVRLDPTDARTRIEAGDALARLWSETGNDVARRAALEHYQTALDLNARFAPEEVMRLREAELAHLADQMSRLGGTTQPSP